MAKGIGKFGTQTTYQVGDPVWVKGRPHDGVAHIVRQHENGNYEVEHNRGIRILSIETKYLKLARPAEDARDKAFLKEWREEQEQAQKRTAELMEKLLSCESLDIDDNQVDPMLIFGGLHAFSVGGELEALRIMDSLAVSLGRSLGYCGAPRSDYSLGERVRVRKGVDESFWRVAQGQTGTVISDPTGLTHIFPVDPMHPKAISVKWDDGETSAIYVTNLEPE